MKSSECKLCNKTLKTIHFSKLKRHVTKYHPDNNVIISKTNQKTENRSKIGSIKIKMNADMLKTACTAIVVNQSWSYNLLNLRIFRKIFDPLNIKREIELMEYSVINDIKSYLKDKLFSLKIDETTRLNRSIIRSKTLAMYEMRQKNIGNYNQTIIKETLTKFNLQLEQIYSVTMDNGCNMIKAIIRIELLNKSVGEIDENADLEEENEDLLVNIQDVTNDLNVYSKSNFLVNCVICAAHTIQLAVVCFKR